MLWFVLFNSLSTSYFSILCTCSKFYSKWPETALKDHRAAAHTFEVCMEWQESRLLQKHNRMLTKNKPTPPQKQLLYFQAFYSLTHDPVESNMNIKHHIKQRYFTGSFAVNGDSELCFFCFLFFFLHRRALWRMSFHWNWQWFPAAVPSAGTQSGETTSVSALSQKVQPETPAGYTPPRPHGWAHSQLKMHFLEKDVISANKVVYFFPFFSDKKAPHNNNIFDLIKSVCKPFIQPVFIDQTTTILFQANFIQTL